MTPRTRRPRPASGRSSAPGSSAWRGASEPLAIPARWTYPPRMHKRLAPLLVVIGVTAAPWRASLEAADHGDSPSVAASPRTDLNDVFAWMQDASGAEPSRVNLAMTVYRDVPPATGFSPSAQYVFHVTKHEA